MSEKLKAQKTFSISLLSKQVKLRVNPESRILVTFRGRFEEGIEEYTQPTQSP